MTLISVTKTILFTLDNTTASAYAAIDIPFLVSKIVVKQFAIDKSNNYTGLQTNALLQSELVQNNFLTYINMTNLYYQTAPNISYEYTNPIAIRGSYKFTLLQNVVAGGGFSIFPLVGSQHNIGLIIEFIK